MEKVDEENTVKRLSYVADVCLRHDDLKEMLDSNKDSLKLEAMKRIVAMIARGKNTSDLFPAVVKNVACKNIEESLLEESAEKAFYGSDEEETEEKDEKEEVAALAKRKPYVMDPDHRLLLRNTKPLLQSRNAAGTVPNKKRTAGHQSWVSAVVLVLGAHTDSAQCSGAPDSADPLRQLRSSALTVWCEVQYVVLQNVATMSIKRRGMFEPYLKSFYIRSTDPTQIKVLKLEVLTNLANETNISTILREFQTYIKSMDKDFVAASIQAIGRCATNIGEVRDTCLNGLVQLLSNQDELVVAESVVVIKKLLQIQPAQHSDIIKHMAKLTDSIQTKLLTQYVLNLAKYDQNYDIRDRARFIRQLIVPTEKSGVLSKYAKKLFLALKPAPVFESPFKDRDHFQLGSLSHLLNWYNVKTIGEQNSDCSGFWVQVVPEWTKCSSREKRKEKVEKPFYSDSEGESGPTESADSESELPSEMESGGGSGSEEGGSGSGSEESDEGSESGKEKKKKPEKIKVRKTLPESAESEQSGEEEKSARKWKERKASSESSSEEEEESSSESSSSESESEEESESEPETKKKKKMISPSFSSVKTYELLHRITGEGLAVEYCFSRQPYSLDPHMVAVQIQFSNNTDTEAKSLRIQEPKLMSGMRMQEFPEIEVLAPGETVTVVMGIDFCDSTQAAHFQLCTQTRKFYVSIQPPVGELMMPVFMSENEFKKEQGHLMGMNEINEKLTMGEKCQSDHAIVQRVTSAANLSRVPCGSDREYRFAAKTMASGSLVLVTVVTKEGMAAQLTVNCEKMVIGTMLVKDILQALSQ
ncbi:UNVERIFIED_CONTAM: hypothetical protein FKN15_035399 [Acipenser sinensis]